MNLGYLKSETGKHPGANNVCHHNRRGSRQTHAPRVVILPGWRTGDRLVDNDWHNNNGPMDPLVYSDAGTALAVEQMIDLDGPNRRLLPPVRPSTSVDEGD